MSLPYDKTKIDRAKDLRRHMTAQEKKIWYQFLSRYPIRFQRQKVISGFITDFYCAKAMLVVEIDGNQHTTEQGAAYDADRTVVFNKMNLEVIRFSNSDVDEHFGRVSKSIDEKVKERMRELSSCRL